MKPVAKAVAILPTERYLEMWVLFVLLAVGAFTGCKLSAEPPATGATTLTSEEAKPAAEKELVATFAGGCFWCTEAVFERMEGVGDVISGYIGGSVPNPTYEQVCSKTTGHAEAIEIRYDPSKVTYEELLEVFFKTHDPTTLNQQGADKGPQYRSSVFYHDEEQRKEAEAYIKKLDKSGEYDREIVTLLEKATTFYPAEDYHQDFFRKNPNYGYCQAVVVNKVRKFNRNFGDKIKEDLK
ncbi:peptide-methionine (S)-S-oxide reductase MsrA [Stieleria sp. JC731]|uniref:peptide-methionine (S)-S-oxide reductase MsrA n=1 Tax=Pirellulaceae TaxID=2691357 RepID=UPI001E452A70|nr:peptide-methionine (S)-S-oxide reductase MsrA [Stieleria sp. JC731]MCC9603953.1 peptide-methionine (S)-S-oxide reductase MsrA [Stieleria sp. JC731]